MTACGELSDGVCACGDVPTDRGPVGEPAVCADNSAAVEIAPSASERSCVRTTEQTNLARRQRIASQFPPPSQSAASSSSGSSSVLT